MIDSSIARFSFEGDIEAAKEQVGLGRKLLTDLLQRMQLGGLQTGARARPLGGGVDGYIYVRVNGGVNAVRIIVGDRIGETQERTIGLGAPDFVSGIVTDGRLMSTRNPASGRHINYLAKFFPTPRTTLTHRDLTSDVPKGMERLAVEPYSAFPELRAPESSRYPFTQYARLRPTMYSGRMKKVVQALMGFGRQLPRDSRTGQDQNVEIPGNDASRINASRTRSIYAKVFEALLGSRDALRARNHKPTNYERDVARDGLQIRYDYRFSRTHGIHTAADGALWLVEISQGRGVLAMPLPFHELTKRPPPPKPGESPEPWRFYDALEHLKLDVTVEGAEVQQVEVRDEDGLYILDELGGFPTGESFPSGRDVLDAMVRAGEVIELLKPENLSAFYDHSMYSSAMGWAFSESGKEAHNTGYRYTEQGVQRGVHYAINLSIGALSAAASASGAEAIRDRVRNASISVENGPDLRPILERKALRLTDVQVLQLNQITGEAHFLRALDDLVVAPIATGSAGMLLQREGWLINPGRRTPYQIKFDEPLLGFLLSHDFTPEPHGRGFSAPCDTTMHVFYDGDELKWVRYFFDPASAPGDAAEDDFEECMLVGSWTSTQTSGPRAITRGYYTGDHDDRQMVGSSQTVTKIKSQYLGATSVQVGDNPADIRVNFVLRTHTFKRFTDTISETGQDILTAIAVPNGSREAYYMAFMKFAETYSHSQSYGYVHKGDKYWAEGWRCIVSTAGFAYWPTDMRECPPGCDTRINYPGGRGLPPSANPRVARYIHENDFPCVEFTDKGPWIKKCDNIDALVYQIPLPPLPATVSETTSRKSHLDVRLVLGGEPRQKTVLQQDYKGGAWVYPLWFVPSPDPESGATQFIACTFNALGDRPSAAYDTDLNNGPDRYGSPAYPTMGGSNTCYIGVI